MVNMMAADPSLTIKAAARAIAQGWEGPLERHVERLRKLYSTLKKQGKLPPVEDESSRLQRRADAIRALYGQRNDQFEKAKKDLASAENKARSFGITIDDPSNLLPMIHELERLRDGLEVLARSSTDVAFAILLEQGITDPEKAVERVTEAMTVFRETTENIELLREIRNFRAILKLPPFS